MRVSPLDESISKPTLYSERCRTCLNRTGACLKNKLAASQTVLENIEDVQEESQHHEVDDNPIDQLEDIFVNEEGVNPSFNESLLTQFEAVVAPKRKATKAAADYNNARFDLTSPPNLQILRSARCKRERTERKREEAARKRMIHEISHATRISARDLVEASTSNESSTKKPTKRPMEVTDLELGSKKRKTRKSLETRRADSDPALVDGCNKANCQRYFSESDHHFKCPACPRRYHLECLPDYVHAQLQQLDVVSDIDDDVREAFIDCDLCE